MLREWEQGLLHYLPQAPLGCCHLLIITVPLGMEFGVRLGTAASELAISFDVPIIEKRDPIFPAEVSIHAEDGGSFVLFISRTL